MGSIGCRRKNAVGRGGSERLPGKEVLSVADGGANREKSPDARILQRACIGFWQNFRLVDSFGLSGNAFQIDVYQMSTVEVLEACFGR